VLTIFLRKTGGVCTPTAFLLKVKSTIYRIQTNIKKKGKRNCREEQRNKEGKRRKEGSGLSTLWLRKICNP
jgi:hypothetical protein